MALNLDILLHLFRIAHKDEILSTAELATCARVNREWSYAAMPFLWKHLEVMIAADSCRASQKPQAFDALMRSLRDKDGYSAYASHVRSMSINVRLIPAWGDDVYDVGKMSQAVRTMLKKVRKALYRLPKLQHVTLALNIGDGCLLLNERDELGRVLTRLASALAQCDIQSVTLKLENGSFLDGPTDMPVRLVKTIGRKLNELVVEHEWPFPVNQTLSVMLRNMEPFKRIRLRGMDMHPEVLASLTVHAPFLQEVEIIHQLAFIEPDQATSFFAFLQRCERLETVMVMAKFCPLNHQVAWRRGQPIDPLRYQIQASPHGCRHCDLQATVTTLRIHEEDLFVASATNEEDIQFDEAVGELEEMLMDPAFIQLDQAFLSKYCHHFTDDDENKLIYTDIFHQYVSMLESYIEKRLQTRLKWFSMPKFMSMMSPERLQGDVFDVLTTLGDFSAFKDMMLSYKHEKEGTAMDLSSLLAITTGNNKPSKSTFCGTKANV
ncbi:ADP-ribosylation factor-like protein 2-binding protein [Gaertneriomyces sp. JEL0708]|nr:ADP-ribosylation factor-like protein 2-binding protein [Gaertneriomyces sp. JEL0708]